MGGCWEGAVSRAGEVLHWLVGEAEVRLGRVHEDVCPKYQKKSFPLLGLFRFLCDLIPKSVV